jgi:dTDP-4-dehydrorhamnose 3,5-epimerase
MASSLLSNGTRPSIERRQTDVIFTAVSLPGTFLLEPELREDERGFFARVWCSREFTAHGLDARLAQTSVSFNKRAGTLRGMHYQEEPFGEAKLIRCTRGSLFDVVIDLREHSPTYMQHFSVVLSCGSRKMLYVPSGLAHGFQTLEHETEVTYHISEFYHPDYARGVRWNDPAFGIKWPRADHRIITRRDQSYPDFQHQPKERDVVTR